MNREQWLERAVRKVRPFFKKAGHALPDNVRVACGHMGSGTRATHIGECWHSSASADKGREIWIRPDQVNSLEVLGILIHELCHAALPDGTGHRKAFSDLGKAMLLQGKPTAMASGSEEFHDFWVEFIDKLGHYPQPRFVAGMTLKPKQSTRMIKFECVDGCGMIFRTSAKWAESVSQCPCCGGAL